jgi:ParB-like chromosome segregation protein Spo0J
MKTLQQQATEMLETIDTVEGEKKYARLTPSDRALIFRLAAKGNITQAEIAKAVGCDPSTVTRTLQLLDTRSEARTILESGAARLADTVVKTADAGIALKALGKLDVVREDTAPSGPQVMVVLGATIDPLQPPDSAVVAVPPDPTDS